MSEGFNNMLHFVGVVEDIHDRTNSGRVRVRAFGIHPPRAEEGQEDSVPTAHLPWATVLDGTYGVAPVIPSVGEWVFGFFIDGREAQQPIITVDFLVCTYKCLWVVVSLAKMVIYPMKQ